MGEIADAYIWGEMNGIDMNDNPDAWVQYYKELDEYEEYVARRKEARRKRGQYYRPLLLAKGGKQIPNNPIIKLGDWLCYYKNGYARDRHRKWVKISLDKLLTENDNGKNGTKMD